MASHHTKFITLVNSLATLFKHHLVWGVQNGWWLVIICKIKFTQVKGASLWR